ncbi:MAG: RNase P subunit p30 family protein [Candidatus Methanofastidiosia archaeon]
MLRNYLAVDLRGFKNDYFVKVASLKRGEGDYFTFELTRENFDNRRKIIKKEKPDIVFAKGGDLTFNRKALESKEVDVLSHPYPIDDTLAKIAHRNEKFFEICINDIVSVRGYLRAKLIQNLSRTIEIAKKRNILLLVTSGATNIFDMVVPREMVAFGKILGLTYNESKASIYDIPLKALSREGSL